jgi:hypothetical protein
MCMEKSKAYEKNTENLHRLLQFISERMKDKIYFYVDLYLCKKALK